MKVYLGNKYNSYIYTARNAKVSSARIVYEKTVLIIAKKQLKRDK